MSECTNTRIGEVVEAETQVFTVQCYRLYDSPPLGAIVQTIDPSVFGVVSQIRTHALDPGRPIIARGEDQATVEDVYRSNPQLDRLLCTTFQVIAIGYFEEQTLVQRMPPVPPKIHSFVYHCPIREVKSFAASLGFLHFLLNTNAPTGDEIAIACLKYINSTIDNGEEFLVSGGKTLAMMLSGQIPRLNSILRRLG